MLINSKDLMHLEARMVRKMEDNAERYDKVIDFINSKFSKQHKAMSILYKKLGSMEINNNFLSSEVGKETERMTFLNNNFHKTIESFKLLEKKATKQLIDGTKTDISEMISKLSKTTDKYQKLESNLISLDKKVTNAKSQITKFEKLANQISEKDFDMTKTIRLITAEQKKNAKLLEENEKLKKIVSKERQKKRKNTK